jgi:hypothetical protein
MKREKITWPVIFDNGGTDGPISTRWGVTGWPTTYVIDAKGVIRHKEVRDQEMSDAVAALVAEAKGKKK